MAKIKAYEALWNEIKRKHLELLSKYHEQGIKYKKFIVDMGVLLDKFHAIMDAAERIKDTDIEGKSPEMMEWKRVEPMYNYLINFMNRNNEFMGSKMFCDFADAVTKTFVNRMNAINSRIHSKPHNSDHIIKIFLPFDREIDAMIALYPMIEKIQIDIMEEFEDIKRVAAFGD